MSTPPPIHHKTETKKQTHSSSKKILRIFGWTMLTFLCLIISSLVLGVVWLNSTHGHKTIAHIINKQAAPALHIDSFVWGLSAIHIDKIRIYDTTQQAWLTIDKASFGIDWSALWTKNDRALCIAYIHAHAVHMHALPVYADEPLDSIPTEDDTIDWRVALQESLTAVQSTLPTWLPSLRIAHIEVSASAAPQCLAEMGLLHSEDKKEDKKTGSLQEIAIPHITLNAKDIFFSANTSVSTENIPCIGASIDIHANDTANILPFASAHINVTLQGDVVRPHIDVHTAVHALVLDTKEQEHDTTVQCNVNIQTDLQALSLNITGQTQLENIPQNIYATPQLTVDFTTKAQYTPASQEHGILLHNVDITVPMGQIQGHGTWHATPSTAQRLLPYIEADLTCHIHDLGILRTIPHLSAPTAGKVTSTLHIKTAQDHTHMDASVQCHVEHVQWGEALATLTPIVGDTAHIRTQLSIKETHNAAQTSLALTVNECDIQMKAVQSALQGSVHAVLAQDTLQVHNISTDMQAQTTIHTLDAFTPEVHGALNILLTAEGTLLDTERNATQNSPLHVNIDFQAPHIDMAEQQLKNVRLTTDFTAHMQDIYAKAPVQVQTHIKAAAASSMGNLDLQLAGSIEHTPHETQGNTTIRIDSLHTLFAGVQIQGNIQAQVPITTEHTYPALDGALSVRVHDWKALSALVGTVKAQHASTDIIFTTQEKNHTQSAQIKLDIQQLHTHDKGPRIQSIAFSATADDIFGQLTAAIKGNIGKTTLLPECMWREASLEGQWQGTLEKPVGTLQMRIDDMRYGAAAALQKAALQHAQNTDAHTAAIQSISVVGDIDIRVQPPTLTAQVNINGLGTTPLQTTATLPLYHRVGMPPTIDGKTAMHASIDWDGKLQDLWRFLPLPDTRAQGTLALHAHINGPLGGILEATSPLTPTDMRPLQPTLAVKLTQGSITDMASGIAVQNIALALDTVPNGQTTLLLTADDAKNGTVKSTAAINIFSLDDAIKATANIHNFAPLHRDDIQATLSGDVQIQGSIDAPHIAGTLSIDSGEVLLEELAGANIPSIDVINAEDAERKQEIAKQQSPQNASTKSKETSNTGSLAIDIHIPNRFFVRGMGLESEWRGMLSITGAPQLPNITGNISSVRGDLSLLGKTFTISRGTIQFPGGWPPQPMLDMALEYTDSNYTAIIAVEGSAQDPQVNLSSQPSMPQDEIISYVLFGRTPNQLSQTEVLQLAMATASLTSGSSATGILSNAKNALGVDVLRIGSTANQSNSTQGTRTNPFAGPNFNDSSSDSTSSATLESGKYVLDNVYVGVEQGMGENSSSAVVNIEVTKNIHIMGKTSGTGSEIGANWVWDY